MNATTGHEDMIDQLVQKYADIKEAYDINPEVLNLTNQKWSWGAFYFLSEVPILGDFYEIF